MIASTYDALRVDTLNDAIALGYPLGHGSNRQFVDKSYAVRCGTLFLGWSLRVAHAEDRIAGHAMRHVDTITLLRAPNRAYKTERWVLAEDLAAWCGTALGEDAEMYALRLVAEYASTIANRVVNIRPEYHNDHLIYIEHFLMEDLERNPDLLDVEWKQHARAILAAQRIMRRVLT